MLARTENADVTLAEAVQHWLARFEQALTGSDQAQLKALFHRQSYWRDLLALTWDIGTVSGADAIASGLLAHAARVCPVRFEIDPNRTPPRNVRRAGTSAIEAIFRFETAVGRGSGVLRLTPDAGDSRGLNAWTLLTALDEMTGFPERVGRARPTGQSYSRDFRGPNW